MIDQQTVRVAALNNRVPGAVLALEVIGAAIALGLLAFYLALVGQGVVTVVLAGRARQRSPARDVRPRSSDEASSRSRTRRSSTFAPP